MLGTKQTLPHMLEAKKLSKKPKLVTKKRQQGKAESGVRAGAGLAPSKQEHGRFPGPKSPESQGQTKTAPK